MTLRDDQLSQQGRNYRKQAKTSPEKNKINHRRGYVARKEHPEVQSCSIEGCETIGERHHPDPDKHDEIVWLCKKHHGAEHRKTERKCTYEGCDKKHKARGYCMGHYMKIVSRQTLSNPNEFIESEKKDEN